MIDSYVFRRAKNNKWLGRFYWSQKIVQNPALKCGKFHFVKFMPKRGMSKYRKGSHTVTRLNCHVVWVTKYRYQILKGDIQKRC